MFKLIEGRLLTAAGIFFLIYTANVVVGKIAVLYGATVIPGLGDVGEVLVLFAAICLFIAATIKREANKRKVE